MHPVEIRPAKLIYSTFAQQDLVLFTLFEHAFKVWQKKKNPATFWSRIKLYVDLKEVKQELKSGTLYVFMKTSPLHITHTCTHCNTHGPRPHHKNTHMTLHKRSFNTLSSPSDIMHH